MITTLAVWTTAYVNTLPDSAFLYIAPGGSKDGENKTVPRSLRYFPVRNAEGGVDLPHLRNALSRIPQADIPAAAKQAATSKARRLLRGEDAASVLASMSAVLLADDAATPPDRLLLFKKGLNETTKGVFLFDEQAARDVMAAFEAHGADLPFDFDHAMVAGGSPRDRVAAGWFRLAVEDGNLYAVGIKWTPTATNQIQDREWRYISPAFLAEATDKGPRRIKKLLNVALTNLPATARMEPIAAHAADDNTETDDMHEIIALTGADDIDQARAVVLSWKAKAERTDALEAEVKTLKDNAEKAEFGQAIQEALNDGRLMPAKREAVEKIFATHGLAVALSSLALLDKPSVRRVLPPEGEGDNIPETLSAVDREIMEKYGFSEEAMKASKARDAKQKRKEG